MKTLIVLAAGQGTRLRPLTDSLPKCLVKIEDKSMLEMLLVHFEGWADQLIIVTGYCSEEIDNFIASKKLEIPVHLIKNNQFEITNSLYSAWLTKKYWDDSNQLIFTNSDVVFNLGSLEDLLESEKQIALSVDVKDCDEEDMRVSINPDTDLITRVSKEIPLIDSYGEFTGVSKLQSKGISLFQNIVEKMINEPSMKEKGWYDLAFDRIASELENLNYVALPINSYFEIDTLDDLNEVKESNLPKAI